MNFAQWLEFSDGGGEVSYNHMNNVVSGDFNKIRSKYMAGNVKDEKKIDLIKIYGKKTKK
jgi:hypothetical protein